MLGTTKWWDLGFSVSHSRTLITHPAAPPATSTAEGWTALTCVARVTSYYLVLWLHHCTNTYFCHHMWLLMHHEQNWVAVLRPCNSTSSQSPQEGSGQEEACQQAGQIGHLEANKGTSETDQFTVNLCFFCQCYWINLLIWASAWGFFKIFNGTTFKGDKLKFSIF